MKEIEYVLTTNLARIDSALQILRDVTHGNAYGVDSARFTEALAVLTELRDDLFESHYVANVEQEPDQGH